MRAQLPVSASSEAARCFGGAGLGGAAATLCMTLIDYLATPAATGPMPYGVDGGPSGMLSLAAQLAGIMGGCAVVGGPLIAGARWLGRRAGRFAVPIRYGSAIACFFVFALIVAPPEASALGPTSALWVVIAATIAIMIADYIDHLDRRAACAS